MAGDTTGEAAQGGPGRRRPRALWAVGWVLLVAGGLLLAVPIEFELHGHRWVYEGLTGIAAAALGLILVLASLSEDRLQRFRKMRMEVGTIVLVGGFACGIVYAIQSTNAADKPLQGVGVLGLIVLVTSLVSSNLMSKEDRITAEEVRTALTMAIVAAYLGLLAFGGKAGDAKPDSILGLALKHFWQILIAVMGFYFTATTVQGVAKTVKGADPPGKDDGAGPKPPKKPGPKKPGT